MTARCVNRWAAVVMAAVALLLTAPMAGAQEEASVYEGLNPGKWTRSFNQMRF